MREFLLVTAALFVFQQSFGQLNIAPSKNGQQNNYLFVDGDVLFVQNDVRLMKNPAQGQESSIYLRSGAELFQGEGQNISNSGTGSISVFAEGSKNAYDYNYWSSPVTAPENGFFGISMLNWPVSEINSQPAQLTTALNGLAKPLTISTRWIYIFNGNNYSNWTFVGGNTIIPPGIGFTMKGTEGKDPVSINGRANNPGNAQRYDFRGRPNSGNIEIPNSQNAYILVGNPYPSTFDLSLFLLENSGTGTLNTTCYGNLSRRNVTTGIAYFWDSKENGSSHYIEDYMGGYGAFSPVDPCTDGIYEPPVFKTTKGVEDGTKGKDFDRRFLPIAQGFMVQGVAAGKTIFRNAHRKIPPEETKPGARTAEMTQKKHTYLKGKTPLSRVQLTISVNDQYKRNISVAFWKEATEGIDAGMDAEAFQLAPTDVGWLHGEDSFVIDVRPFDILDEIPLFLQVKAEPSKVTFSQGIIENTLVNELFIVDTQTNDFFSIKEPLTLELQPGSYHGRFKVAFTMKIGPEELPQVFFEDEAVPAKFSIVQNNHLGELQVIAGEHTPFKAVGIFDLQGKKLLYRSNFENRRSVEFSTRPWVNGIYIVKVTGVDNNKIIKKISVYNN